MRTGRRRDEKSREGAALMMTLLFLSGTAIMAVALLMMSRERTKHAGYLNHAERGELAVEAGFEEAKMLLLNATANDRYVVSQVMINAENPASNDVSQQSRYYYILDPEEKGMSYIPLFAGGVNSVKGFPVDVHEGGLAPGATELFEAGLEMADVIQLPPLTHDTGAGLVREQGKVATGWVYPFASGNAVGVEEKDATVRYTYWIEDLEGFPNLDIVGIPSESNSEGLGLRWHGYGEGDSRVGKSRESEVGAYRFEFPGKIEDRPEGGKYKYAQAVSGQVSPGLSPREMHVYPWAKSYYEAAEHPFAGFAALRRNAWVLPVSGAEVMVAAVLSNTAERESFARRVEPRFAVGLRGYAKQPVIPHGFGYADAGEAAVNLNALLPAMQSAEAGGSEGAAAVSGIAGVISKNLPEFVNRKGGFPENYVETLAAGLVDYVDVDGEPTISGGSYRGMDSYPVMNEVFFRIEYEGYTITPDLMNFRARFVAEPFVELWNPANQKTSISGLSLKISVPDLQGMIVKSSAGQVADFKNTETNKGEAMHPENVNVGVTLEPNEYRVVSFGQMRWEFTLPAMGQAVLTFGRIDPAVAGLLGGKDGKYTRLHYELLWQPDAAKPGTKVVIDSTGRPGPAGANTLHGFHLPRYGNSADNPDDMYRSNVPNTDNSLASGEYMIRAAAPGLAMNHFQEATNFGDARMAYYPYWAQKIVYYTRDGSPGYRNVLLDKAKSGNFTHEARWRDWPDGGYDSPAPPANLVKALTAKKPVRPVDVGPAKAADQRPLLAPSRISNEGRLYSLAELGHVFDPVMWRPDASTAASGVKREQVMEIGTKAVPDPLWGGGNSLRIGRKEHPKFDQPGMRASQLLDLFHVGVPGTNCQFGGITAEEMVEGKVPKDLYREFDPGVHQPPPSGRNAQEAADKAKPYRVIYPEGHHAESPFRWVSGHINLNGVPTVLEMESLLRGNYAAMQMKWSGAGWKTEFGAVDYGNQGLGVMAEHGLSEDAIGKIARTLYDKRPFVSNSHLAQVVGEAVEAHLPQDPSLPAVARARSYCSDAMAEEIFARIHNATTLSSRHFRVHVHGEVISKALKLPNGTEIREGGRLLARASRVYEVFLNPVRDAAGKITAVRLEVLNAKIR